MNEWQSVYDSEAMVRQYNERLKIIGIRVEERDDVVLNTIPHRQHDAFRILDLGAGIGRFTTKLREKFPHAQIVCLDGSEKMLEAAKSILKDDENILFVCKDFGDTSWVKGLSGKFDAVVSTGAIHHVSDIRKRQLFLEVNNLLNDDGYFINGDLIKSKYDVLNAKYYDDIWARYIQQKTREVLGVEREIEDVRQRMYAALKKEGDKPATIEDQIRWLHKAGFTIAECVWQYYLLAVIVGIKFT
jgi:tRNA (cmo5U34)-methyltransferase